jgi:hypothetical protein
MKKYRYEYQLHSWRSYRRAKAATEICKTYAHHLVQSQSMIIPMHPKKKEERTISRMRVYNHLQTDVQIQLLRNCTIETSRSRKCAESC